MLTNFWCFTDDLFICACLQTHGARVFENHRQLHILDEYWLSTKVGLDQFWTSFFRSPLFGSALFQGHFCRKKVWFSQSLVHLGGASYIDHITAPSIEFWSRSKPPRADLDAWLLFFYMKLVEEPLGALPSCCHLLDADIGQCFPVLNKKINFDWMVYPDSIFLMVFDGLESWPGSLLGVCVWKAQWRKVVQLRTKLLLFIIMSIFW